MLKLRKLALKKKNKGPGSGRNQNKLNILEEALQEAKLKKNQNRIKSNEASDFIAEVESFLF